MMMLQEMRGSGSSNRLWWGGPKERTRPEIHLHNLRDYTDDKWRRVDDYPYGGFAGMVMKCQPIDACISKLKSERNYDEVIFTSPDGEQFTSMWPTTCR